MEENKNVVEETVEEEAVDETPVAQEAGVEIEKTEKQLKIEKVATRIDDVLVEENFSMIPVVQQIGQFDYRVGVRFVDLSELPVKQEEAVMEDKGETCEDKPSE